jgi:hypothetical protein
MRITLEKAKEMNLKVGERIELTLKNSATPYVYMGYFSQFMEGVKSHNYTGTKDYIELYNTCITNGLKLKEKIDLNKVQAIERLEKKVLGVKEK